MEELAGGGYSAIFVGFFLWFGCDSLIPIKRVLRCQCQFRISMRLQSQQKKKTVMIRLDRWSQE